MNKVRIIFSLSVLFILINVTIFSIVKINEQQRIGSALDTHLDRLEAHFKMLMYHQSLTADAAYKSTVNKKVVIDILSEASGDSTKERKAVLRKKLQKILDAKYKILKAKGVLQYHFVLPNNKVFLRMHKPSKFGDSLADIRFSFKYTNSTHKKVSGFEQGKTSHGFRNVYPIFDENKNLISSIEISFSSDEIQEHLTTIGKIHTHFLVYKHILDEKAWIREDIVNKYIISAENPEYLITMTKNHLKKTCVDENKKRLEPILSQIDEKIFRGEKFALYSKYNDKVFVVSFYPIKNIKDKKTVAWIVSYENDDFINMTLKSNLYIEIISFLILIVLFYFIYRVFNQKIEIDIELKEKSKILDKNKKEDWIKEGLGGLNKELSGDNDIVKVCNNAVKYLCEYLKAGVGALYTYDNDDKQLHLYGTYAYVERKDVSNKFKFGEGTVGQVALQKTPIQLENVIRTHSTITTGTTSEPPLNTYTFPLIYQDELLGVIEIGSTIFFDNQQKDFLEMSDAVIATKLFLAMQNKKVKDLLDKSQKTNVELKKQQKQLEDSNIQMQEQQALLEESNSQMEEQQTQLEEANSQMEEQQVQLKESEKELKIQNKKLENSKDELKKKANDLEESNRYKSEFLANMSHELRTPLNSVILLSSMLSQNKKENLTADDIKKAKIINSSGEDLLRLINDVLDLSKVEAGRMELNIESFQSSKFCQKIGDMFETSIENKGLEFVIEDRYNDNINTDIDKLSQVIKNFLSNSLKFTHEGSIKLLIEPEDSNKVKISVKDTGIGIAQNKQDLVFKAFAQADGSTSRKYGGTGLGLSITKELVKLMDGEVLLNSKEGKGSTFSIIIPNITNNKPREQQKKSVEIESKIKTEPKIIQKDDDFIKDDSEKLISTDKPFLIIEDNEEFALTLKNVINENGDFALIATNGQKGLELANRYKNIQGILLDLGLPDIDGIEVLKELKTNISTRKLPVYIISGSNKQNDTKLMSAVGFKQKPLSYDDLQNVFNDFNKYNSKKVKDLLIVEDDMVQREAMVELTSDCSVKSKGVADISEAKKELSKGIYDAVIIDLSLSGEHGLEVCEYIKNSRLNIPIIIYTGKELSEEEEGKIKQYTDSIVIKSVNSQNKLVDEVDMFLHRIKKSTSASTKEVMVSDINFDGKKIMVVDDDMRNTFVLVEILEERGAEVLTAYNGKEAIDLLLENKDTNVVLMDIMMPVMDGYEAITEIRDTDDIKDIPIIAVTAKAMAQDKENCLKVGANDFLTKPLNLETFVGVVKAWIK